MQTNRDDNYVTVAMGVSSDDGVTPIPITMDATTGRLRCHIQGADGNANTPTRNVANRDENRNETMMAETDDSNRTTTPLGINNNGLMCQAT